MKYKVKILKQPKYQDGGITIGDFSNLTEDQLENGLVYGFNEEPEEMVVANSGNNRPTLEALVPAQYKIKPIEKEPMVGVPISVLQKLQKPKYNNTSIVNFLNKINAPSSYKARKKLAAENNIKNYTGTASQNLKLLSILNNKNKSYQYGGNMEQEDGGQQQVLQIIQAYAEASGVDPKELMTKLQSMDAEEQQQIIAQMYQALQGGGAEQQQQQSYSQNMQQEESDDDSYNEEDDMREEDPYNEEDDMRQAAYGGQMGYGLDLGSRRLWMNQDDDEQSLVHRSIKEVPREEANIEAEGGETALIPNKDDNNYSHFNIQGKRHTNGGVPLNVPEGTFIYSDTKKMKLGGSVLKVFGKSDKTSKKYTPAALAKQYDLNKYTAILESPKSSQIERRTAELMIQNYNKKLAQLALVQEEKKGYPQGIPAVAKEYYAKTKAYVEEQQVKNKPQEMQEQQSGEDVDQDMEQGEQLQAMYGMGFKYGGGLQRFQKGNEFKGIPYSYTKPSLTQNDLLGIQPIFTPNKNTNERPTPPYGNEYKGIPFNLENSKKENLYDESLVVENNNPQFEGWGDSEAGKKYGAIAANYANNLNNNNNAVAQSVAKGLVKGAVTSKNEDEDEFKINKSNIEYGWSNPDKLNLLNSFINLAGVRKATPFEPTVKFQRPETRYIDPARALAANTEQYNAARQAAAMFAGPQSRYSFNAGQFGKNAADIISQYGNQNVQLGNVAAAQDADITNKQIMYDAQRAKRLYDAGVIGEQQYQNAMKQARAGVLQAYGQGMKNAADIYNMSMSQSPYYGIDRKRGTIYFHSPKAMSNFYSQQNQSPNYSYASAWKRAQEDADGMNFKSDKERETYIDKAAADYYSKSSTPSRRRTT